MASAGIIPLPELDLFSLPPSQQSIERDLITEHRSLSSLDPNHPIQFEVRTAKDEYIKLNETDLRLNIKLTWTGYRDEDATKILSEHLCFANNSLSSIFSHLRLYIGDNEVTFNSQNYGFVAYFHSLFGSNEMAKKTHMTCAGWEWDRIEEVIKERNRNTHMTATIDMPVKYEFIGKLFTDMALQHKALMGGSKLRLELVPNKPEFYLLKDLPGEIKIEFTDAILYLHRAKVTSLIVEAHEKALDIAPARYPIAHCEVKAFNIPQGVTEYNNDNLVLGQLPRRIILGLNRVAAYTGAYNRNPYNFGHYDLNYCAAFLNGIQYPIRAFTPDWSDGSTLSKEYLALFENMNQDGSMTEVGITREKWLSGYTLYAINFAADLADGSNSFGHVSDRKNGALRLLLKFKTATTENLTAICFMEFDNMVYIDKNRNGYTDINRWIPQ